ncbi:hypothetical protein LO762_06475 [Actinocorallia sp. API 0066]|uniref:hypothetical protein n=1 Tax=Actinocorallia sp. API 0066 TaxID=2896846 RepID=UPI001E377455|nr:hypothetical protein [Actinocorallia sp. API 0066]MCD0448837.1 hypothetical protein [Actinocorallia sp. API 0066]
MGNVRLGRRTTVGVIVAAGVWLGLPAAAHAAPATAPTAATAVSGGPGCDFVFPPLPGCHDQDAFTGLGDSHFF